ncbi:MAG: lactate racemization operon protein LarA, partial [Oscillospiraceae bacterium]|nr:lactate racemization operon protein LarA [Oscillospiraceae bacterium]
FLEEKNIDKIMDTFLKTKKEDTIIDQWESQVLARVLKKAKVIYISDLDDEMIKNMHLIPAHSIEEAVLMAEEILNDKDAKILAIPDGISIII